MFLSAYHFDGDPTDLIPAYERAMALIPSDDLLVHVCVVRDGGITMFDACPTEEVFRAFSSSPGLAALLASSGLPAPRLEPLGDVHRVVAPA